MSVKDGTRCRAQGPTDDKFRSFVAIPIRLQINQMKKVLLSFSLIFCAAHAVAQQGFDYSSLPSKQDPELYSKENIDRFICSDIWDLADGAMLWRQQGKRLYAYLEFLEEQDPYYEGLEAVSIEIAIDAWARPILDTWDEQRLERHNFADKYKILCQRGRGFEGFWP